MADTGELKPGMLLGGCRIERLLGSGGMGEVYLAEHLVLQKPVAIKTARAKLQNQQQARERFLKEARLAAKVDHQNVITIYDAGELNGLLYIVMQFVDGQDLAQVLKAAPAPLEWPVVLTWIRDAARGLEAVHKRGLIHRDIKPHNIMLTPEGRVLVMDFGLVREEDPDASMTSGIVGSPAYMSPEQCRSERLDHRSDIYSLGTTAYNLLSGNPPFLEKSVHLMIMKVAGYTVAERLDSVRADIPAEVAELVARSMEPHREQRIADAHTLVLELDHLLRVAPVAAGEARHGGERWHPPAESGMDHSRASSSAGISPHDRGSQSRASRPALVIETANSSVRDTHQARRPAPMLRRMPLIGLLAATAFMAALVGVAAWGAGLFSGRSGAVPDVEVAQASPPGGEPAASVPHKVAPNKVAPKAPLEAVAPMAESSTAGAPVAQAKPVPESTTGPEMPPEPRKTEVALSPDKGKSGSAAAGASIGSLKTSAPVRSSAGPPIEKMPKESPPPPVKTRPELLQSPFTAAKAGAARKGWSEFLGIPETVTSIGTEPLLLIPAGEFQMGSTSEQLDAVLKFDPSFKKEYAADEQPAHHVQITKPFYLGQHELTKGEFAAFVTAESYKTEAERDGKGGYGFDEQEESFSQKPEYTWRNPGFAQTDSHPVVNVSWNDAVAYCNWRSRKEGKPAAYKIEGETTTFTGEPGYRLPTEAEWEYACRAGSQAIFSCGDEPARLAAVGNIADGTAKAKLSKSNISTIAATDGFVFTAPVGQFQANAFGAKDMHGNVWEWCQDIYDAKAYGGRGSATVDPFVTVGEGSDRVVRGGSWSYTAGFGRSASRDRSTPSRRLSYNGFRLALSPSGRSARHVCPMTRTSHVYNSVGF